MKNEYANRWIITLAPLIGGTLYLKSLPSNLSCVSWTDDILEALSFGNARRATALVQELAGRCAGENLGLRFFLKWPYLNDGDKLFTDSEWSYIEDNQPA